MKKIIVLFLLIFINTGFIIAQTKRKEDQKLFQAEQAFAKMSEEKGVAAAFSAFLADDAVLLPHQGNPVSGREAIVKYLGNDFRLLWKPLKAEVAKSGELGYTYGTSETRFTDKDGKEQVRYGKFMSVWRKQKDGSWKVILDMGNHSPAPSAK